MELLGILMFFLIMLCIIWEIATAEDHDGAFLACGTSLVLGFIVFFGLM